MHQSKNGTLITLDKTNKTHILISFQLNIQLFIKIYNIKKENT